MPEKEEEARMLNIERYKEKLVNIVKREGGQLPAVSRKTGTPTDCGSLATCKDCELFSFDEGRCHPWEFFEWCLEKAKED